MSGPYIRKRREPLVLFLDDCFDAVDAPRKLKQLGFEHVEVFVDSFPRELDGGKEQGVKDPAVLRLCNAKKWLLVTTDSDIRFAHLEVIKRCPDLAILATAHNNVENLGVWIEALGKARPWIEREFKIRQRPWFGQFNKQGKSTTIYSVNDDHRTRRS